MSADGRPMPAFAMPRPRKRTWFALFLLAVGAILGGVPGWRMVFASWMVFSWFLLACVVTSSLLYGLGHAVARSWEAMRIDFGQVGYMLLAAIVFPLMFELPAWVDLAASWSDLRTEAAQHARAGETRFAATHIYGRGSEGGTVYDPSGEVAKPVERRSQRWYDGIAVRFWLNQDCVEFRHLVGPYYHWSNPCDRFL